MNRKAAASGIVLLLLMMGMVATELVNSPYPLSGDATRGTRGGTRGGSTAPPPPQQLLVLPQPSCVDGLRNSVETDVDCGGPTCPKCVVGKSCISGADCLSALCQGGICQAVVQPTVVSPPAPSCTDGIKNGAEAAVDCGGSSCPKCANGQSCLVGSDCVSGSCVNGVCQALPTCTDAVKNGQESDVDCGGVSCVKCELGKKCVLDTDCSTNKCSNGVCADAKVGLSCNRNQCGGTGVYLASGACSASAPTVYPSNSCNCNGFINQCTGQCSSSGCASNQVCQNNQCVATCSGTDTNNYGQRCGGTCSDKCEHGKLCNADADCLFSGNYNSGGAGTTCMYSPNDGQKRCIYCGPQSYKKFYSTTDANRGSFTDEYSFGNLGVLNTGESFAVVDGVTIGQVNWVNFGPGQCLWLSLRQAGSNIDVAFQSPPLHTEDYTSSNADSQNRKSKSATGVMLKGAYYGFGVNCPTSITDFTLKYRACRT